MREKVLRRICAPKGEEVIEGNRKLHKYKLHDLYFSPRIMVIKTRIMRWVSTCGTGGRNVKCEQAIF
jgi:hypothetical protein